MTVTEPQQMPAEGPPPIYDADRLVARINLLDPERQARLRDAWATQGLGQIAGLLLDADGYRRLEQLVSGFEPGATGDEAWQRMSKAAEAFYALPEHIQSSCAEALSVYAGIANPRVLDITSSGRIAEMERIVAEAVEYAAELTGQQGHTHDFDKILLGGGMACTICDDIEPGSLPIPSVADLPPVDDKADQVASEDYPGPKADAKTVMAWVEWPMVKPGAQEMAASNASASLNRAARAYALEQERTAPRKKLSAWLVERLGPDGLAKVNEALAAAAPPPLDLGAAPTAPGTAGAVGPETSGSPSVVSSEDSAPPVEAEPTAPATIGATADIDSLGLFDGMARRDRVVILEAIAAAHRLLADLHIELAEVTG